MHASLRSEGTVHVVAFRALARFVVLFSLILLILHLLVSIAEKCRYLALAVVYVLRFYFCVSLVLSTVPQLWVDKHAVSCFPTLHCLPVPSLAIYVLYKTPKYYSTNSISSLIWERGPVIGEATP